MQFCFVAYHYDANAIMVFPMKNRLDAEFTCLLIAFYKCCKTGLFPQTYTYWTMNGPIVCKK